MKKRIYSLSLIFFLIDLISKIIVINHKEYPVTIINNFFYINKVTNEGAAFSSFSGYQIILILIAIIVLIYINKTIIKEINTKLGIISISMLIGGILGNLFDRIFYNKVIDFLSFKIANYQFPIFNIADTLICIGIILLILEYIRGEKNENRSNKK